MENEGINVLRYEPDAAYFNGTYSYWFDTIKVSIMFTSIFANLHEWVRVSEGAPFVKPCATSKQITTICFKFSTIEGFIRLPTK